MGDLDVHYQRCVAEWSDISMFLPAMHALVTSMGARTIIELGVRGGNSTTMWLHALAERTPPGHLWSVDPAGHGLPIVVESGWTFIQGDDLDPDVLAQLPAEADIVFIDTIHTYAQTVAELNTYLPRVRPAGKVVLHDSYLDMEGERPLPVRAAIEDVLAGTAHTVEYNDTWPGLAIIST